MKVALVLHVASLAIGYGIFGCLHLTGSKPSFANDSNIFVIVLSLAGCGFMGFATGMALMLPRKGRGESVLLATSTIAAFVLLMLASGGVMG